jgi:hypothetical protein
MHALARRIFSKLKEIDPSDSISTNGEGPFIGIETQISGVNPLTRTEKVEVELHDTKESQGKESAVNDEENSLQTSPVRTTSGTY